MSKKNFERIAIILESILKVIEKRNEIYETEINYIEGYLNGFIKIILEFMIASAEIRKLDLGIKPKDLEKFGEIVNRPHEDVPKLEKEFEDQTRYFHSEKKLLSKELKERLEDIKDFIKRINIEKE